MKRAVLWPRVEPDRLRREFDSDRVNSSRTAYRFGLPDGPMSLALR